MQRQAQRYKQPKKNWNWIAFCSPDSKTIRSCINHTFILTLPNWPARTRWCGGCVQVMQRQACADLYCVPPPAYRTPCNVLLSTDYLQFLELKKKSFSRPFLKGVGWERKLQSFLFSSWKLGLKSKWVCFALQHSAAFFLIGPVQFSPSSPFRTWVSHFPSPSWPLTPSLMHGPFKIVWISIHVKNKFQRSIMPYGKK